MEISRLDGIGLKELLTKKEISTVELVEYYQKKKEELNPELNAIVYEMFEYAKDKNQQPAKESTLAGIPFLIKDLNNIAGHPTTSGSRLTKEFVAKQNDEIVNRFEKAGLVFIGKTNTPEFGFLPTTEPELLGATKNPWDLTRSAGGSSGGAAAAVAAGMAPFAHASDGGGSIRIPASACGLFGLKPSRGRMPYSPFMNDFAVSHALTRSVRDSAALLDILKGTSPIEGYPTLANEGSFLSAIEERPSKLRIAFSPDWNGQTMIDDEVRKAVNYTVNLLERLGHEVEFVTPEFEYSTFVNDFITAWIVSGAVIIKQMAQVVSKEPNEENLEALSYHVLQQADKYSASFYEETLVRLRLLTKKVAAFHQKYDILVSPVINKLPSKLGAFKEQKHAVHDMLDNMLNYCSFTQLANVTGQPSMSVPLYWNQDNLPIGTQFTARLGEEKTLLKLAKQLEEANPWFDKYELLAEKFTEKSRLG